MAALTTKKIFWWTFSINVLVSTCAFVIPTYIIRPFRYQSPKALLWAMAIREHAPAWSLVGACLGLLIAWRLWFGTGRLGKTLIVTGMVLATASAVMSRLNYFEWMFHPVRQPGFESASQTKLDGSEMVLTLNFNNDARAYPIREMAYHHVVNDVVSGVPVAVTY